MKKCILELVRRDYGLVAYMKLAVMATFAFMLTACGGNYEGETDEVSSNVALGLVVNEMGRAAYNEQCASCHGSAGEGTANGPSLVSCASCTTVETLAARIESTMPLNNVEACEDECATNTAEFILVAFNGLLFGSVESLATGVTIMSPKATLRKASLNLTGRLPTETELASVDSDAALDAQLDNLLSEEAFFERLIEMYNDTLLQDKYLGSENALSLMRDEDFPSRRWYRDLGLDLDITEERDLYYYLRAQTNDAIAREILHLISYVVRHELPFTEMLTANYTMVNAFSARAYGVESQLSFGTLTEAEYPAYPQDPEDFQPVVLAAIPHAGILTSPMFLNRFPTTDTNRNRHRARMVFDMFLDTDILAIEGTRPDDALDLLGDNPTLDNPQCTVCHNIMDPVAATFQNWDEMGRYRPTSVFGDWYTDMLARGFNGEVMPLAGYADASLQWLANQIVADPRFARATVKTAFKALSGQEPLTPPNSEADPTAPEWQQYLAQQNFFTQLQTVLIDNNWNLKSVLKEIIKSAYWRAETLTLADADLLYSEFGSARLLTPEMLDRKISAVLGQDWVFWSDRHYLTDPSSNSFRQLYGGIDSDNITQRITEPNGMMVAVQARMASEMGCQVVTRDFFKLRAERSIFPHISIDTSPVDADGLPVDSAIAAIKQNMQHLHWTFFGRELEANDPEIDATFTLFEQIREQGVAELAREGTELSSSLPWNCQLYYHPETGDVLPTEQRIRLDEEYLIRAWIGVLNYLLADYRFVYE